MDSVDTRVQLVDGVVFFVTPTSRISIEELSDEESKGLWDASASETIIGKTIMGSYFEPENESWSGYNSVARTWLIFTDGTSWEVPSEPERWWSGDDRYYSRHSVSSAGVVKMEFA